MQNKMLDRIVADERSATNKSLIVVMKIGYKNFYVPRHRNMNDAFVAPCFTKAMRRHGRTLHHFKTLFSIFCSNMLSFQSNTFNFLNDDKKQKGSAKMPTLYLLTH